MAVSEKDRKGKEIIQQNVMLLARSFRLLLDSKCLVTAVSKHCTESFSYFATALHF